MTESLERRAEELIDAPLFNFPSTQGPEGVRLIDWIGEARRMLRELLSENRQIRANDEALMRERAIQESRAEAAEARVRELETATEGSRKVDGSSSSEVPPEGICGLCGRPMPPGEEMFMYHGYSGPCPTQEEK